MLVHFLFWRGRNGKYCLGQSVPDIETDFARPVPRSKPVNNLAHQNLLPVHRLCDPIEGTNRARLAQCLGKCLLTTCHGDPSWHGWCKVLTPGATGPWPLPISRSVVSVPSGCSEPYKDAFVVRCGACECSAPVKYGRIFIPSARSLFFDPHVAFQESLVKAKGVTCPMYDKLRALTQRVCRSERISTGAMRAGPSVTTQHVEIVHGWWASMGDDAWRACA